MLVGGQGVQLRVMCLLQRNASKGQDLLSSMAHNRDACSLSQQASSLTVYAQATGHWNANSHISRCERVACPWRSDGKVLQATSKAHLSCARHKYGLSKSLNTCYGFAADLDGGNGDVEEAPEEAHKRAIDHAEHIHRKDLVHLRTRQMMCRNPI